MRNTAPTVRLLPSSLNRIDETISRTPPTPSQLREAIHAQFKALLEFCAGSSGAGGDQTFKTFETALLPQLFELGRLLISLFLCVREERVREDLPAHQEVDGKRYQQRPPQARNLHTLFGVVRYWRAYMRGPVTAEGRRGFHPLDVRLGLTADRMSMNLLSLATRLATKLSFA
ncbi:MAG: hypothetical protein ACT4TC_10675, partial [Myxococcaceae bacterium]